MQSLRSLRRGLVGVVALAACLVATPVGTGVVSVHAAGSATLAGGGEFHPLAPTRIFDSRTYDGGPINDPAAGPKPITGVASTFNVNVLGQGGIPTAPDQVLAIAVSVTVTAPTSQGVLGAYAAGSAPATLTSVLNFNAGQTVANMAILSPGTGGNITVALFGGNGSAQVVVDVFGWFSTSSVAAGALSGSRLIPVAPGRILDTRDDTNLPGRGRLPLAPGESVDVPVRGVTSVSPTTPNLVPNSPTVVGVVLNVVGITDRPGGAPTYLSVTPDAVPAGTPPTTSNVNLPAGMIKSNLVIVPVGDDGKAHIYNYIGGGKTDVAVDVVGYMQTVSDPTTYTGRVIPLSAPYRTFDTRDPNFGGAPLGPGVAESWSFADFAASVKIAGGTVGPQSAVIGNLTNASLTRQYRTVPVLSYLTAWMGGQSRPMTSYINSNENPPAVANMAILPYGPNNTVQFYNYAGNAHYLFDASAVVLS
ncbi:MAG: hypothetical protein ABIQ39_05025 [Ilumatobacteraceae bacterium]